MSTRVILAAVCAAAIAQVGCAGGEGGDEPVLVPQLRMVGADGRPSSLTLGATDRIEGRNTDAFAREGLGIERTVWVRSEGSCERLGRAGPPLATGDVTDPVGPAPGGGFALETDAGSTAALDTLAGLGAGDALSLLVFWSVPELQFEEEPILLDAAEYGFTKEAADTDMPGLILLRPREGALSTGDDPVDGGPADGGPVDAAPIAGTPPCGPLVARTLEEALDPDGDGIDSLDAIDTGRLVVGAEPPVTASIDAIVFDEGAFPLTEPLYATWRLEEDAAPGGERTLTLSPRGAPDGRVPLELRLAVRSDDLGGGTLVSEVVLPPGFPTEGRDIRVDADYALADDLSNPVPFDCPLDADTPLDPEPSLPSVGDAGAADGLYLDADGRVLVRCSSADFGPAGPGLRPDDTSSLLITVEVTERAGGAGTLGWIADGETVLIHRDGFDPGSSPDTP